MLVAQQDLKKLLREARSAYERGSDTVYSPKGMISPGDLQFCMGSFDVALFYHDHQMDIEYYRGYDVRAFYEATVLISQQRVDPEEYLVVRPGSNTYIDLGGFILRRQLPASLDFEMKYATWDFEQVADPDRRLSKGQEIADILEDLALLSKTPKGHQQALALWRQYAPVQAPLPDFFQAILNGNKTDPVVLSSKASPPAKMPRVIREVRKQRIRGGRGRPPNG